jgi:hypothetical protein
MEVARIFYLALGLKTIADKLLELVMRNLLQR